MKASAWIQLVDDVNAKSKFQFGKGIGSEDLFLKKNLISAEFVQKNGKMSLKTKEKGIYYETR
ncbi:hypothetical protein JWG45_13230 [Leptospira sp. 201903070]|uniref:Uncharacterized protein n=1 Tax=Leptospira ainlahdjerensis TaxID=2810033 RepID=A0ABS2UDT4_9LEPT|nr:hypothetical protein [Leptospira ainlahdjerensis]MBM9578113.1 hypothetical protein [Leptospira ainlahdjerensis]